MEKKEIIRKCRRFLAEQDLACKRVYTDKSSGIRFYGIFRPSGNSFAPVREHVVGTDKKDCQDVKKVCDQLQMLVGDEHVVGVRSCTAQDSLFWFSILVTWGREIPKTMPEDSWVYMAA